VGVTKPEEEKEHAGALPLPGGSLDEEGDDAEKETVQEKKPNIEDSPSWYGPPAKEKGKERNPQLFRLREKSKFRQSRKKGGRRTT